MRIKKKMRKTTTKLCATRNFHLLKHCHSFGGYNWTFFILYMRACVCVCPVAGHEWCSPFIGRRQCLSADAT